MPQVDNGDSTTAPPPRTLKPEDNPPPSPPQKQPIASKDEGTAQVKAAKQAYNDYVSQSLKNGVVLDESGGVVYKLVPKPASSKPSFGTVDALTSGSDSTSSDGATSSYIRIPDPVATQLLFESNQAQADLKDFLSNNGSGAGRSYLSTETDKQQEVTRQFKDFLARAQGVYDLSAKEQAYNMAADNQNAKNDAAMRSGTLGYGQAGMYVPMTFASYSGYPSELAQTVPDSVPPDYKLNSAVGLPGGEGFPTYADGTQIQMTPFIQANLGKPYIFDVTHLPPSNTPWPWGGGPLR